MTKSRTRNAIASLDPHTVTLIIPARYRKGSVQFCEWLERRFPLDCCQAGTITKKAQLVFIGRRSHPSMGKVARGFSEWLKTPEFNLDDFSTAAITRKAEEVFFSAPNKPLASLAEAKNSAEEKRKVARRNRQPKKLRSERAALELRR